MKFDCPRSCRWAEQKDLCRFQAMFAAIGPVVVTSHTATIKAEFADKDRLAGAVVALGGTVIGNGTHKLFSESKTGYGFTLKGWRYPIICGEDGTLAFDNYNGAWGNVADLERLKGEYVIQTAEQSAMALGWQTQRNGAELTVYHPTGATMTVNASGAEANGFSGRGCHEALMSLGLPMDQFTAKPENSQVACEVQTQS